MENISLNPDTILDDSSLFPDYLYRYLKSIGFKRETNNRLSFTPGYKWEKFSLIVTQCNHFSFHIYKEDKVLPDRTIFQGFRINSLNELIFLISANADFSSLFKKQLKNS